MKEHFRVAGSCPGTSARLGQLTTSHGVVETPVFMPVASQGTVKALDPEDLKAIGSTIVLSNTYHLYLRPGVGFVEGLGGLHRFMGWDGPILTDSGGFQVLSLATLRRIDDDGVLFRSHVDGSEHFFTPELVMEYERKLGADIVMPLDECSAYGQEREQLRISMERTHRWAERSVKSHQGEQHLYGIVQGGVFSDLRRQSAAAMTALDFDGYALGGLSIGEPKSVTWEMVGETVPLLPVTKTRYLMGVGSPEDVVRGVDHGIDMFDCALPTRVARNGALFTATARKNITNAMYRTREEAVEEGCDCYTCRSFSAAYLHHLFNAHELLAYRLATIHNLRFMMRLFESMRKSIRAGQFSHFMRSFLAAYQTTDEEVRIAQKQKWMKRNRREDSPDSR